MAVSDPYAGLGVEDSPAVATDPYKGIGVETPAGSDPYAGIGKEETAPAESPDTSPGVLRTARDVGSAIEKGFANAITTTGQGIAMAGRGLRIGGLERAGESTRKYGQGLEDWWQGTMAPENAAPESFGRKALMSAAESAPSMLSALIPGAGIAAGTRALGLGLKASKLARIAKAGEFIANRAGKIGGSVAEGVQAGMQNAAQERDAIEKMSDADLMSHPKFKEAFDATDSALPPENRMAQARENVAVSAENEIMAKTTPWTGGFSLLTGAGVIGQILDKPLKMGATMLRNVGKNAWQGVSREAIQEFFQSGGEYWIQEKAAQKAYDETRVPTAEGVVENAALGAVSGALLGGMGGASKGVETNIKFKKATALGLDDKRAGELATSEHDAVKAYDMARHTGMPDQIAYNFALAETPEQRHQVVGQFLNDAKLLMQKTVYDMAIDAGLTTEEATAVVHADDSVGELNRITGIKADKVAAVMREQWEARNAPMDEQANTPEQIEQNDARITQVEQVISENEKAVNPDDPANLDAFEKHAIAMQVRDGKSRLLAQRDVREAMKPLLADREARRNALIEFRKATNPQFESPDVLNRRMSAKSGKVRVNPVTGQQEATLVSTQSSPAPQPNLPKPVPDAVHAEAQAAGLIIPGAAPASPVEASVAQAVQTPAPERGSLPAGVPATTVDQIQFNILKESGIPEGEMPDYALDSMADGATLRSTATLVSQGKLTVSEAANKVRGDWERAKVAEAAIDKSQGKPITSPVAAPESTPAGSSASASGAGEGSLSASRQTDTANQSLPAREAVSGQKETEKGGDTSLVEGDQIDMHLKYQDENNGMLPALPRPHYVRIAEANGIETKGKTPRQMMAELRELRDTKAKEAANAVQEQGAGDVLQRQQEEAGGAGGERGRVEQGQQGNETPGSVGVAEATRQAVPITATQPDDSGKARLSPKGGKAIFGSTTGDGETQSFVGVHMKDNHGSFNFLAKFKSDNAVRWRVSNGNKIFMWGTPSKAQRDSIKKYLSDNYDVDVDLAQTPFGAVRLSPKEGEPSEQKPVTEFFAKRAFNVEGHKSRSKVVDMKIDDFLALVPPVAGSAKSNRAEKAMKKGRKWDSIPQLLVKTTGDTSKIMEHEGRNRALLLKSMGYDTIPVEIRDREIRWSEQGDKSKFDYVENLPKTLKAQAGATDESFSVSHPIARESATLKYGEKPSTQVESPSIAVEGSTRSEGAGTGGKQGRGGVTSTAAFKAWFGKSKIVDKSGNPIIVYHGTDAHDFSTFRLGDKNDHGEGIWFSGEKTDGVWSRMVPAYIRIEKPYYTTEQYEVEEGLADPSFAAKMKRGGYDGIIYADPNDMTKGGPGQTDQSQFVVFDPNQVKHATENSGAFSKGSANIRMSPKQAPAIPFELRPYFTRGKNMPNEQTAKTQAGMIHKQNLPAANAMLAGFYSAHPEVTPHPPDWYQPPAGSSAKAAPAPAPAATGVTPETVTAPPTASPRIEAKQYTKQYLADLTKAMKGLTAAMTAMQTGRPVVIPTIPRLNDERVPVETTDSAGLPDFPANVPRDQAKRFVTPIPPKKEQDRNILFAGIRDLVALLKKAIPTFQGGKSSLALPVAWNIRHVWKESQRKAVTILNDYFGGSGGWGIFMARGGNYDNVKEINVYEHDADRVEKIKMFYEKGNKYMLLMEQSGLAAKLSAIESEMFVPTAGGKKVTSVYAFATRMQKLLDEKPNDPLWRALIKSIMDYSTTGRASRLSAGEIIAPSAALDTVSRHARDLFDAVTELKNRGVKITVSQADSYSLPVVHGKHVLSNFDPPYYNTAGYQPDGGRDRNDITFYRKNVAMLERLVAADNNIIYTDEVWWLPNKYDKPGTAERAKQDAERPEAEGLLGKAQGLFNHFDIWKVGARFETIGMRNAMEEPGQAERLSQKQIDKFSPKTLAPAFYSQLRKVITDKMPNRASVAQIRGLIDPQKGSGIKKDELEWSGLSDFLDAHKPTDLLTKEEVLAAAQDFVLEEKMLGENKPSYEEWLMKEHGLKPEDAGVAFRNMYNNAEWNNIDGSTQYSQYNEPGGDQGSERELLFKVPSDEYHVAMKRWAQERGINDIATAEREFKKATGRNPNEQTREFSAPHFKGEKNLMAHVRFDTVTDKDGKKTLRIQEFQSDWHSQGQEKGYQSNDSIPESAMFDSATNDWTVYDKSGKRLFETSLFGMNDSESDVVNWAKGQKGVPNAPYKDISKGWPQLLMRRMVRYAAENGYDRIAWTPSVMQVERWATNLRQKVDRVEWTRIANDNSVYVMALKGGYYAMAQQEIPLDKTTMIHGEEVTLEGLLGKSMATKIRADIAEGKRDGSFEGDDLTLGGGFFQLLYDQSMVGIANDMLKKYGGGKAEKSDFNAPPNGHGWKDPVFDIPQDAQDDIIEQAHDEAKKEGISEESNGEDGYREWVTRRQAELSEEWAQAHPKNAPTTKQWWTMPITPALKEAALYQGFPRFAPRQNLQSASDRGTTSAGGQDNERTGQDEGARQGRGLPRYADTSAGREAQLGSQGRGAGSDVRTEGGQAAGRGHGASNVGMGAEQDALLGQDVLPSGRKVSSSPRYAGNSRQALSSDIEAVKSEIAGMSQVVADSISHDPEWEASSRFKAYSALLKSVGVEKVVAIKSSRCKGGYLPISGIITLDRAATLGTVLHELYHARYANDESDAVALADMIDPVKVKSETSKKSYTIDLSKESDDYVSEEGAGYAIEGELSLDAILKDGVSKEDARSLMEKIKADRSPVGSGGGSTSMSPKSETASPDSIRKAVLDNAGRLDTRMTGTKAWLTPDGKWINVYDHSDALPYDQVPLDTSVPDMTKAGFVRVAWEQNMRGTSRSYTAGEGGMLHAEYDRSTITPMQRAELKNTAIEKGGEVVYDPGYANFSPKESNTDALKKQVDDYAKQLDAMKQAGVEIPSETQAAFDEMKAKLNEVQQSESSKADAKASIPSLMADANKAIAGLATNSAEADEARQALADALGDEEAGNDARKVAEGRVSLRKAIERLVERVSRGEQSSLLTVKKDIIRIVKARLPVDQRGKMLQHVAKAKNADDIEEAVLAIDRYAEEHQKGKLKDLIRKISEKAIDSPAVAVDYKQRIRELLDGVLLTKPTQATIDKVQATKDYIESELKAGREAEVPRRILDKLRILTATPAITMDVAELEDIVGELNLLAKQGKAKLDARKALDAAQKEKDYNALKAQGTRKIESADMEKGDLGELPTWGMKMRNLLNASRDNLRKWYLWHTPTDRVFDILDNNLHYRGIIFAMYKGRPGQAYAEFRRFMFPIEQEFKAIIEKHKIGKRESDRVGIYAVAKQRNGDDKNYGRKKIYNNYNAKTDAQKADIDRQIDAIVLTPDEQAYYDFMRQKMDEVRPMLAKAAKDIFNADLDQVADYFPMKTDWDLQENEVLDGWTLDKDHQLIQKTPEDSMMKKRTGAGNQRVRTDSAKAFMKHMNDAYYLINMAPVTRYLNEFAKRADVKELVGDEGQRYLIDYVDTLARRGGIGGEHIIEWVDALRRNVGVGTLGFRLSSILIQPSSFIDSLGKVGPRWGLKGATNIMTDSKWRKFVFDNMQQVRDRIGDDPAYAESGALKWLNKATQYGYLPLEIFDRYTAAAVGAAAYEKYMHEHGLEVDLDKPNADALAEAELTVRLTQASGNFMDVPQVVSRGKGYNSKTLAKAIYQFQTFTMNKFSYMAHDMIGYGVSDREWGKAFMMMLWAFMAYLTEEAVRANLKVALGGERKKTDSILDEAMIDFATSVPILGPIINSTRYGSVPVPVVSTVQNLQKSVSSLATAKTPEGKERAGLSAAGALGTLAGIPGSGQVSQFFRTLIHSDSEKVGRLINDSAKRLPQTASAGLIALESQKAYNRAKAQGLLNPKTTPAEFRARYKARFKAINAP